MPDISDHEVRSKAFLSSEEIAMMTGYLHAHRRIIISGQLNDKSLKKATLELLKLELQNHDPITILLESIGGDVASTQYFEDVIGMMNSPVDVVVLGECCSMAVDLVLMCRKRMVLPSTRFLIHYIRNSQPWIIDDIEQIEVDLKYFRERMAEIRDRRFALYEKRTGLPHEKILEIFRHGEMHKAYFSASQAIQLGLADEVLENFKLLPIKKEE